MLQRVEIEGIRFPRLYIAQNDEDVAIARNAGIPYVKWRWSQEKLIRMLLRPTLEKMFPGINWNKVLGYRTKVISEIEFHPGCTDDSEHEITDYDADKMLASQLEHDKEPKQPKQFESEEYSRSVPIAVDERNCAGDFKLGYDVFNEEPVSIEDYVGDLSSSVDIEALQKLSLLPKFVGDIADCIKFNLSENMKWNEGYTKKLGVPLGNFRSRGQLPNLIIIDVSASIPDGIAATMLTLADTLRSQCNAELIITSKRSGYYPIGAELPTPDTLRSYYGRSNESAEFMSILKNHIAGREFGHVISFGDNDNPGSITWQYDTKSGEYISVCMANTKVHEVHHYHTGYEIETGYARWVTECCPNVKQDYDTSWCKIMRKDYSL